MEISRRTLLKMSVASAPGAALLSGALAQANAQEGAPTPASSPGAGAPAGDIAKAFVCFRIGVPIWSNEARFNELLDLFDKNRGVTDEVTLFTSETHPPLPLAVIQERMPIMKARMAAARARGYRSGINILSTVGHHEENLANSLQGDSTRMTDPNGAVSRGVFCPNDERHKQYVVAVYEALAGADPDYIWIDDDVRLMGHMPIGACCFCDTCIGRFNARNSTSFTRDALRDALSTGARDERLKLRREFLQHNRETIGDLFRLIEKTVHAIKPDMTLGFMTGDRFYEGYDFDTWAEILAGPRHTPVFWRPGGGTYRDERPADIMDKAHDIGRQTALLPAHVRCIESEIESFPYQRLKKSANATALEAAAYIASGCTGAAYNVMSQYDEPLGEFAPLVARLGAGRPFLDILARTFGRHPSLGIHNGWVKDLYVSSGVDGGWFGWIAPGHCNELWATGLPASYTAANAPVTALSGDQVFALTEAEIREMFSKGVLMDGPALARLNELGYGALTGFEVAEVRHDDCIEEQTDHPLNGAYAGRRRNGRQSFWKCPTYFLKETADGARSLSRCVDYTYKEVHPCCMGVFENAQGGRVCVAGYYPWEQLQNLSKSAQLKNVARWLSKDTLPAYVGSFHRTNLWLRQPAPDKVAVALVNGYLDVAEGLELLVRADRDSATVIDMRAGETRIQATGADGPYKRFVLPTVQPWEMVLVTI